MKSSFVSTPNLQRKWCSGIILASHACDRGSIPRLRRRFAHTTAKNAPIQFTEQLRYAVAKMDTDIQTCYNAVGLSAQLSSDLRGNMLYRPLLQNAVQRHYNLLFCSIAA